MGLFSKTDETEAELKERQERDRQRDEWQRRIAESHPVSPDEPQPVVCGFAPGQWPPRGGTCILAHGHEGQHRNGLNNLWPVDTSDLPLL